MLLLFLGKLGLFHGHNFFLRFWGSLFVQCSLKIHPIASSRFLLSTEGVITTRSNRMKFRLRSVLFSYKWCESRLVTVCKLDSQISPPASKNSADKRAKFLKARKVSHFFSSSWVLRWVFGGKMLWKLSFWAIWRALRKLDDLLHFAWWAPAFK